MEFDIRLIYCKLLFISLIFVGCNSYLIGKQQPHSGHHAFKHCECKTGSEVSCRAYILASRYCERIKSTENSEHITPSPKSLKVGFQKLKATKAIQNLQLEWQSPKSANEHQISYEHTYKYEVKLKWPNSGETCAVIGFRFDDDKEGRLSRKQMNNPFNFKLSCSVALDPLVMRYSVNVDSLLPRTSRPDALKSELETVVRNPLFVNITARNFILEEFHKRVKYGHGKSDVTLKLSNAVPRQYSYILINEKSIVRRGHGNTPILKLSGLTGGDYRLEFKSLRNTPLQKFNVNIHPNKGVNCTDLSNCDMKEILKDPINIKYHGVSIFLILGGVLVFLVSLLVIGLLFVSRLRSKRTFVRLREDKLFSTPQSKYFVGKNSSPYKWHSLSLPTPTAET